MERNSRIVSISEEAAEWFVRLKDGRLSIAEQRQYLHWLKQSPAHIAEMLRVSRVYGLLHDSKLKEHVSIEEPASNVVEMSAHEGLTSALPLRRARPRHWQIAAAFSAIALGAVLMLAQTGWPHRTVETEAGEWRHFALGDGSTVRAGPRTRLRIDFEEARRSISLDRGEAVFHVAKDAARPFVVQAGLAVVRAVGTEFGVVRDRDDVVVTVAQGRVAVSQGGDAALPALLQEDSKGTAVNEVVPLAAGEQVSVSRSGRAAVRQVDVVSELAWAEGRLIFESETVAQAVREFNRRNRMQIRVDDDSIAVRPMRGVFNAADPEAFASFLAAAADSTVVREAHDLLVLKPRTPTPVERVSASGER